MTRRALWFGAMALVAAGCSGADSTRPPDQQVPPPPSFAISDGAHGGNPDVWFLPPMVSNPAGSPGYLDHGLNLGLPAEVEITKMPSGDVVLPRTPASVTGDQYHLNWKVPSDAQTLYRVNIWVGSEVIAFADLWTSSSNSVLKNVTTNEYVPLKDGRMLPIKFQIEQYALCEPAGTGPCSSASVSLADGGLVTYTDAEGVERGGVEIPPQGGPAGAPVVVTVAACPDIPSDLPHYGSCLRVTADPVLSTPLSPPATVYVCDAPFGALTNSEKRITMHRYDAPNTQALPHAHDDCTTHVGDAGWTLRGLLADLVHGRMKSAGRQVLAMLGPQPLHAAMFLHQGGGGETAGFSDFQLLQPAWMTRCDGYDLPATAGGTVTPKVCVTDVGGEPVEGAQVHFATSDGSVSAASALTNSLGEASVTWTLGNAGANSLTASGNGIAAPDPGNNGPRTGPNDTFQPLSTSPVIGGGIDGPAVDVLTGTVTFTATTIQNPDFEILYKAGSTTITANPFTAFTAIGGTSNMGMTGPSRQFSDASFGTSYDLAGWTFDETMGVAYLGESLVGPGHGNVAWFNGNSFGGGTAGKSMSQVLGEDLEQGVTYTLTADFGWRTDNGIATTPPVLNLYAGGTLLVPIAQVSPPLVQGALVTYSRTYKVENLSIAGALEVEVGLGPNTVGDQLNADHVTLHKSYTP